jgi:hypothetical protein
VVASPRRIPSRVVEARTSTMLWRTSDKTVEGQKFAIGFATQRHDVYPAMLLRTGVYQNTVAEVGGTPSGGFATEGCDGCGLWP